MVIENFNYFPKTSLPNIILVVKSSSYGFIEAPKYLDHSRYIPAPREATITHPTLRVYSVSWLFSGSELLESIHSEKGFTSLAYTIGVGQSSNDYLHSGESESAVVAKSTELGISAFLT